MTLSALDQADGRARAAGARSCSARPTPTSSTRAATPGHCARRAAATFGGSSGAISGPTASPVNTWTHVALTYDGTTLRLYVNGTQVATQAATGAIQSSTNPLWIGGNRPYGEYFQGLIDEVRVYNRALTPAEIQADMSTSIGADGARHDAAGHAGRAQRRGRRRRARST